MSLIEEFLDTDYRYGSLQVYFTDPTCSRLEPRFHKALSESNLRRGNQVLENGLVIARVYQGDIYGIEGWLERPERKRHVLALIKNPLDSDLPESLQYGERNGLFLDRDSGYLFVVRLYQGLKKQFMYAVRPVIKPYQAILRAPVEEILEPQIASQIPTLPPPPPLPGRRLGIY